MNVENGKSLPMPKPTADTDHGALSPWVRSVLAAAGITLGGVILTLTGVRSQIEALTVNDARHEAELRLQQQQLQRIETKLDRITESLPRKSP